MPSVTIWHRLEPAPDESRFPRGPKGIVPDPLLGGLQARVRDPLWMLARQRQLAELTASNGGSPVSATIATSSAPITGYRPSLAGRGGALPSTLPLDAHVEREEVALGLRGAVQLGLRFEALLDDLRPTLGDAAVDGLLAAFRAEYEIPAQAPAAELSDTRADELRLVAAGRVVDGNALYEAAANAPGNVPAAPAGGAPAAPALQAFVAYRRSLYAEPGAEPSAWETDTARQLQYRFSVSSGSLTMSAPEYRGSALEWHSFSVGAETLAEAPATQVDDDEWTFLPQNLIFRGMPNARWWNLELSGTDFGQLDAEHVDTAKLAVMEFALVYGNDWFELPLPLSVGTVSRVTTLVVTDTFGVRTLIRPTESLAAAGERQWSAFRLSSPSGVADFLFLPPSLGQVADGPDLEDVLFVRDEMAAMGWGVEEKLQGPLDTPLDGYEPYFRRVAEFQAAQPPAAPPAAGAPEIAYILGNSVPDNWIPLVPVQTATSAYVFRRGLMEVTASGLVGAVAHGRVLEPWRPFYVADQAIPREGVRVVRYFRRARWIDGSTWTWVGRRISPGTGPGASGLGFDLVERAT